MIHAKRKLKMCDELCLQELLIDVLHSCGSQLIDCIGGDASPLRKELFGRVFIGANLTCTDNMETPYYSSEVFKDVCVHCGNSGNIVKGQEAAAILPTYDLSER